MRNNLSKFAFTAIIATLFPLMSCDSSSALVGRWVRVPDGGQVIELLDDGTGILGQGASITWKTDKGRLYINDRSGTNGFDYKVKGSALTIGEAEYVNCKKNCYEALKEYFNIEKGSFTDARDKKSYKTIKFDNQTWMAENLNYATEGSKCDYDSYCEKYGRLYNWPTAVLACPKGWHLPSGEEWQSLVDFTGGDKAAGNILKASSGWGIDNNGGLDAIDFSALPGGGGGGRLNAPFAGYWWSASEGYYRDMANNYNNVGNGQGSYSSWASVRCVQGEKTAEAVAKAEAVIAKMKADSIERKKNQDILNRLWN